jgi:hypothetical protein
MCSLQAWPICAFEHACPRRQPWLTIAGKLPVMTAADRTLWAQFREEYLGEGVSRASLEAIERAVSLLAQSRLLPTLSALLSFIFPWLSPSLPPLRC